MNIKRQWTITDYSNPGGGFTNRYLFECHKAAREFAEKLLEDGADRDDVFLTNPDGLPLMLKWQRQENRDRKARGFQPRSEYYGPGGAGGE